MCPGQRRACERAEGIDFGTGKKPVAKGHAKIRTRRTSKRTLTKRTLRRSTKLTRQQHSLKHSPDKRNSDKRGQRQRRAKTLKLLQVRSPDGPKDSACRPRRAGKARRAPFLKEGLNDRPRGRGWAGAGIPSPSALKARVRMSLAESLRGPTARIALQGSESGTSDCEGSRSRRHREGSPRGGGGGAAQAPPEGVGTPKCASNPEGRRQRLGPAERLRPACP